MRSGIFLRAITAIAAAILFGGAAMAQRSPQPVAPAARQATAAVAGGTVRYRVIGDLARSRTPLMILHGAYMSGDGMKPFADRFAATRPIILVDQRGHGRTGDLKGPITYDLLADDAAAVIRAAGVKQADVLGYSMGGGAAVRLAMKHPDLVAKLVAVSASYQSDGIYPELLAGIARITPSLFDNTPIKRDYERQSPTPKAFPTLVEKLKALDATPFDWTAAGMKAIAARTMIVIGDHDGTRPEHAVDMFRLRGGGDTALITAPFLDKAPPAQLAVLPGTSHLGIMAQPDLIVALVTPFLDDAKPAVPPGFF